MPLSAAGTNGSGGGAPSDLAALLGAALASAGAPPSQVCLVFARLLVFARVVACSPLMLLASVNPCASLTGDQRDISLGFFCATSNKSCADSLSQRTACRGLCSVLTCASALFYTLLKTRM